MGADSGNTYTVRREAAIAAPPARIHELINDFRRWREWSPWEDVDPQLERTYSGAEAGVGSVYAWSGNRRAGRGRMEIVESGAPGLVRVDLRFLKPFKARTDCRFDIHPEGEGARVVWTMTGPRTPAMKVMNLFTSMDKMIGPDFEKGLDRLRAAAERATP